ncbi:hypothetical protein L7F22_001907 [Adiantum nelumboides]|nr:hypothetical protein [Adiantum nelumboides]
MPAESARSSTGLVCERIDDKAPVNQPQMIAGIELAPHKYLAARMPTLIESGGPIDRLQSDALQRDLTENSTNVVEPHTEALQQEIFELKRDNGKLGKLLKESQEKLSDFSNERILWEQKKLAEMSNFNAFKESEVHANNFAVSQIANLV